MGRRAVLLLLSFIVAAVGTGLVYAYVHGVDDRALKDQKPVVILVVKKAIPEGATVQAAQASGSFDTKKVAGDSVAPGALSDLTPIKDLVALAPLFPGEQVLSAKFGTAGSSTALAIPPGKLAISVQLTDPARVAGFVTPGSQVAVFVALQDVKNKDLKRAITLLPRLTVLAVGPTTAAPASSTNTEALPRTILTFAVTQQEAQTLVLRIAEGNTLYLGLLNAQSKTSFGPGVTNVLAG